MNHVITPPASRQATVACPVCDNGCLACASCDGLGYHQVDANRYACVCRGTGCRRCEHCEGGGFLTLDEAAEFARETEDADLLALIRERDPELTLEELGFEDVDALYGDLGGEA